MSNKKSAQQPDKPTDRRTRPETRNRIVHAARHLFWQRGYADTSMADILSSANVNSGSFYYLFPSKEAVLTAVLELYLSGLQPEVLDPVFAEISDPIERIFGILARYRHLLVITKLTYGCPLGRLALELDPANRPVFDLIAQNFTLWTDAIRQCLDAARDRLDPKLDHAALSRFILTIMEGAVMQARAHHSLAPFDDSIHQLRDYFSRLLR